MAVLVTALLAGCAPATAVAGGATGPVSARRSPEGSYAVGVRTNPNAAFPPRPLADTARRRRPLAERAA
ncbi:hypothetical protein [Micromonospora sp. NPDC047187]|uniref:hypothetical protein n=1 Tax=Micromonospora sp. NPDC047187 TaxID=3155262 RepID=UPI0033F7159C